MEKIRIIIADDNKGICNFYKNYLEKYDDIEILGLANTDEEEMEMIEKLKPQIVITDLLRNHRYTGLDIIKKYENKQGRPRFLVISSDIRSSVINKGVYFDGYIQKPILDYKIIYNELKSIANIDRKK